jgi:hypothetical protein
MKEYLKEIAVEIRDNFWFLLFLFLMILLGNQIALDGIKAGLIWHI